MTTMGASDVKRIELPFDYSLLTRQEGKAIRGALRLAEDDFNAACRNWQARIEELTIQLTSMPTFSAKRAEIERELTDINERINQAKKKGVYTDYSGLKRRIANGAQWDDIYPEAPLYYARTWDFYLQFVGSNRRKENHSWANNIFTFELIFRPVLVLSMILRTVDELFGVW